MRIDSRICLGLMAAALLPVGGFAQAPITWKIHDMNRPLPPIVDPGTPSTQDAPGKPPSDAVVLFDGKDLTNWENGDKSPAKWKVENGYMEVVAKDRKYSIEKGLRRLPVTRGIYGAAAGGWREPGARE